MTDHEAKDMAALDALFDEIREAGAPEVSDALMARVLADAEDTGVVAQDLAARAGWRDWIAVLGGWPAMGGLVAAGVTGLWIGAAPTGMVSDVMTDMLGETLTVDLLPQLDDFGLEAEG